MKGKDKVGQYQTLSYFADGAPVPDLLTEEEAIRFLRLDDGGTKYPATTLEYYRSEGMLRGTRVGKRLRYLKSELINFLEIQTQRTNGEVS
ncbi:MAG: helix-turn-helix domain-containing protein [Phycisphaerae bacterium]|nr:helix-turn-helix domain-containing protein [Phycisphaerae bacterium]